ncbi:hypothetical protein WJX73_005498 [Symbiochloris irregularis]|uniref:Uncharacterized protein n=1 Tax=Symbiochloris irregularis TaxID=706552 RepID=A0AAW1P1U1_9CHLO
MPANLAKCFGSELCPSSRYAPFKGVRGTRFPVSNVLKASSRAGLAVPRSFSAHRLLITAAGERELDEASI